MSVKFEFVPIYEVRDRAGNVAGYRLDEHVIDGYVYRVLKDAEKPHHYVQLAGFLTYEEATAYALGAYTQREKVAYQVEQLSDTLAVCLLSIDTGVPDLHRIDYRDEDCIL